MVVRRVVRPRDTPKTIFGRFCLHQGSPGQVDGHVQRLSCCLLGVAASDSVCQGAAKSGLVAVVRTP